jgi:hypothetical protein
MLNKTNCENCEKRQNAPKPKASKGFAIDWNIFCKVYCPLSKKEGRDKGTVATREDPPENCPHA